MIVSHDRAEDTDGAVWRGCFASWR